MSTDEHIDDLGGEPGMAYILASLAELAAETPPPAIRDAVLEAVDDRPRRGLDGLDVGSIYQRRVAALNMLLDQLEPDEWTARAQPYDWTVHGLLAHLVVVEEYTARQLGLTGRPPRPIDDPAAVDHLAMDDAEIEQMVSGPPGETIDRWRRAVRHVQDHVFSERFDPQSPAPMHGWPFNAGSALITRCFELWTHAEDIRRATGRPLDPPDPGELRTMSSASANALPILFALGTDLEPAPTRLVLTGPGGGTFDLWGPGPHANLLVIDVVDYCRVAARRAEPDSVIRVSDGDGELLSRLLRASQVIAI